MQGRTIHFWLTCLVVACILPAATVAGFLLFISYQQERASLERDMIGTARALMQTVDAELQGAQSALQALATSPNLANGDLTGFYRQATEALPNLPSNSIFVTDPTGQVRLSTLKPLGEPLPPRTLPELSRRVFETAKPAISDLFAGSITGRPTIAVEVPVFSDGKIIYSMAMGIFPGRLSEILSRQRLPPGWVASIFDGTGTIVARTLAAEQFVGQKGAPKLIRRIAEVAEGIVENNTVDEIPVLAGFTRSPRSGWSMAIYIPKSILTANIRASLEQNVAAAGIVLALGLLLARAISNRIRRSIGTLHGPALALGPPRLLSVPTTGIVEVDEVGRALVKASQIIEERAIERDQAELEIRKIMVAKQAAEQANHAKAEFLASMSHDLRTPLNAISGFAQLLSQPGGTLVRDRQTHYANNILSASEQLGSIINDLLDMARLEAGNINVRCEVLDCLEIMTEVSRTLEILAKNRKILFSVDTSANLPSIVADRKRLIQVLLNLGSNAIKYNTEGGWVLMSAVPHDGMVRFVVRDTGRGIPVEHHGQLFEPFNRLGAEMTQEDGTGIGLAISRRLALAMNGEIGFESVAGAGSKFWVDLPVADGTAAATAGVRTDLSAVAGDSRCKVLYIEDKIANVELMRGIIGDLNNVWLFDAQTVRDGISMACSVKPDLVITDIHLPDGKGFDVLQGLRNDERTAHIPVIALTADAMAANMGNMERAGFDQVLTKPFKIRELMDIMRERLKAA